MLAQIPFRFGRLDFDPAPAFQSRTIHIADDVVQLASGGAANALLPNSYPCMTALQVVPLTAIVLDFSGRQVDYDRDRLMSIVRALQGGVNLPPLSVTAKANGTYELENGYHRFLACAMLGFQSIPIDQGPVVNQPVPRPVATRPWVPRILRDRK